MCVEEGTNSILASNHWTKLKTLFHPPQKRTPMLVTKEISSRNVLGCHETFDDLLWARANQQTSNNQRKVKKDPDAVKPVDFVHQTNKKKKTMTTTRTAKPNVHSRGSAGGGTRLVSRGHTYFVLVVGTPTSRRVPVSRSIMGRCVSFRLFAGQTLDAGAFSDPCLRRLTFHNNNNNKRQEVHLGRHNGKTQ